MTFSVRTITDETNHRQDEAVVFFVGFQQLPQVFLAVRQCFVSIKPQNPFARRMLERLIAGVTETSRPLKANDFCAIALSDLRRLVR